jgi:hypothetical protein
MDIKKVSGEIEVDLMENIIHELPNIDEIYNESFTVYIHGMGGQTRNFYRRLRQNKDVELLWSGWSSKIWWTYIFSFIPGQAGLVKIINRKKLDQLYLDIGAMSLCGLYYLSRQKEQEIIDQVIKDPHGLNFLKILEKETNYFLLEVDFDYHGGDQDGKIFYRKLYLGDQLNENLKRILTKEK